MVEEKPINKVIANAEEIINRRLETFKPEIYDEKIDLEHSDKLKALMSHIMLGMYLEGFHEASRTFGGFLLESTETMEEEGLRILDEKAKGILKNHRGEKR